MQERCIPDKRRKRDECEVESQKDRVKRGSDQKAFNKLSTIVNEHIASLPESLIKIQYAYKKSQ